MAEGFRPKTRTGSFLERLLVAVFPVLLIPKRTWRVPWQQREALGFTRTSRVYFTTFALGYIAHLFLVDIPAQKEPLSLWAGYRLGCAGASLLGLLLTYTRFYGEWRLKRLPLFFVSCICVYMQGQSMIWRAQVPFFYVPILAFLGVSSLRQSVPATVASFFVMLGVAWESFGVRPGETQHMVSASVVALILTVLIRSRQTQEVLAFVAEQEKLEAQKELIEAQSQLVDQLQTFLPREIYRRVEESMRKGGRTALQAADEILRPTEKLCAVLFTDIRGFTGLSKQGKETLLDAVIPAQKSCTDIVERYQGIPRLQGDLVYSYFDDDDASRNLRSAVLAAAEISSKTRSLNMGLEPAMRVRRYSIVTFGRLVVGNIGGTEGARDISVLGSAANLPSRIDTITKEPGLSKFLESDAVVLSSEAKLLLEKLYPRLEVVEADLGALHLEIRDFADERKLYFLPVGESNLAILRQAPDVEVARRFIAEKYVDSAEAEDSSRIAA